MKPYWSNGLAELHQADARAIPLPDASVHCVVTSPPYWGLRDYGLSGWEGGDPECGHTVRNPNTPRQTISGSSKVHDTGLQVFAGQCRRCGATQQAAGIGLEPTLSEWLANIVAVSGEVWRVLRDDGTYWLNLGDAYAGSGKGHQANGFKHGDKQKTNVGSIGLTPIARGKRIDRGKGSGRWGMGDVAVDGLPAKNLMGQPWRAAFALQDDGWILRSAIVWHKPNPMPESVSDRPTSAYEMLFLLTKRAHYFYDADAVRETSETDKWPGIGPQHGKVRNRSEEYTPMHVNAGRNARNVWQIPTQGRPRGPLCHLPQRAPPPLHTGRHQGGRYRARPLCRQRDHRSRSTAARAPRHWPRPKPGVPENCTAADRRHYIAAAHGRIEMGLQLTNRGYGTGLVYSIQATAYIDRETVEGLTNEQLAQLEHHVTEVSRRVFTASVAGMVKGVQKYPSEPLRKDQAAYWRDNKEAGDVQGYWLPHIFSEAVDCANQTGLFADALGVEL